MQDVPLAFTKTSNYYNAISMALKLLTDIKNNRDTHVSINRQQKRARYFATLLQNELNGDVARFTTHQSNLFRNKSACCRLRKVFAESRE